MITDSTTTGILQRGSPDMDGVPGVTQVSSLDSMVICTLVLLILGYSILYLPAVTLPTDSRSKSSTASSGIIPMSKHTTTTA